MDSARTALEKEGDVIRLIKSRRFMHLALKHLLDPALHKELKQRSKLHEVDLQRSISSTTRIQEVSKERSRIYDMSP